MRKLSLSAIALFFHLFGAFAQDSSQYKPRKLHLDEVNFVSAYYSQDGNNSAVTGGIGTERLTDFANTLELKVAGTDKKNRSRNLSLEIGIDAYTSASSDKIDPSTISSPSYSDKRIYPTLNYSITNAPGTLILGASASFSTEYDYKSFGLGFNAARQSEDKNREIGLKLQAYFDTWQVIYPVELRPANGSQFDGHDDSRSPRNSYSASVSFSQIINKRLQVALLIDGIMQQGLLATKYQRVFFTDLSERVENLPDSRIKLPLGLRLNYFVDDRFIIRFFYRYYKDNWGLSAHTMDLELPVKISPFISISPFYRYYTQQQADYFSPYATHAVNEEFYTSDYDLSKFKSQFFGTGLRFSPEKGVLGIAHWTSLELRYGHYIRNSGLHSDIISLNAGFK